ncbi:MAG: hypothetical protein ACRCX2_16355 [Paraclostridium sp.]
MAIQFLTYEDTFMKNGKFYDVRINRDMATAVIESPPSPIAFKAIKNTSIPLSTNHSVEIWQVVNMDGIEAHMNVTSKIYWYIEKPSNNLVINSPVPVDGYVKFY